MAKALYGHLVGNDPRLTWENDRLRARIAVLEAEVERLSLELAAVAGPELEEISLGEALGAVESLHLRPSLA